MERERAKIRELEIQKERERQAMEDVNRHFELSMELAKKVNKLKPSVTHNIFFQLTFHQLLTNIFSSQK